MRSFQVYGVPWHTGHNHALAAMRCISKYGFQVNPWRSWNHTNRPFPKNATLVGEFDPLKHDVAILHVDHSIATDRRKLDLVSSMVEALDLHDFPRVFINHTVPGDEPIPDVFGHWPVVCNSHQAEWEWNEAGLMNTHTITHAYPPDLFFCGRSRPFARAVLTYSVSNDPQYDPELTNEVLSRLEADGVPVYRLGPGMPLRDFEDYREVLQRFLVFLHTGTGCPMPRTRTEAIMCGALCVSVRGHDFDADHSDAADFHDFADDLVNAVKSRLAKPASTRADGLSRAGILQGEMSWESYQQQWEDVLSSVL